MNLKNFTFRILNALVRRSYWYNNIVFDDCSKFWSIKEFDLDVINLGSTNALCAFEYQGSSMKGANLAMKEQSLIADYEILRNYSSFLKHDNPYVIISLSPFSSLEGNNMFFPDKYYTILNIVSIPYANHAKAIELKKIQKAPIYYYPLISLFSDIKRLFIKKHERTLSENELRKDAKEQFKQWMFKYSILDFKNELLIINKDSYSDSIKILSDLISFCIERNFKPIIVLPPVTKYMAELFTEDMFNFYIYKFISEANKYNVPFFNYWQHECFRENNYFQNSYLLNKTGAKKFTQFVLNDISKNMY